jgi:hypothetical protein
MGKVAKVAIPIAIFAGIGFATGGFGLLGPSTSSLVTIGGKTFIASASGAIGTGGATIASMTAAAGGATSGFWSWGAFTAKDAFSLGFSGLSAINSIAAGEARRNDAIRAAQSEERRIRAIQLQALQLEAQTLKNVELSRSAAFAQAAANGLDTRSPSFAAFVEDQDSEAQTNIGNIRVNAEFGIQSSQRAIRQFRSNAGVERASGIINAGRSLFQYASRRA